MIQVPRAAGVFRPIVTRDGQALDRADEPFFEFCELSSSGESEPGALYEVRFGDGRWMLAQEADLEFFTLEP